MTDGQVAALGLSSVFAALVLFTVVRAAWRAERRKNPRPPRPFVVKPEWASFEQREYLPRTFTLRAALSLVVLVLVWTAPLALLAHLNGAPLSDLAHDPTIVAWWTFPTEWVAASVVALFVAPVAAILIIGNRCQDCNGAMEQDVHHGRIVAMCPSCRAVFLKGWRGRGPRGSD